MNLSRKVLAILATISLAPAASAQTNVDVMLVFSDDIGLSTFQKTIVAQRYQDVLSEVYEDQLDGDETVTVWPLLVPEMSYAAGDRDNAEALQWMVDQNADSLSALRSGREALGNPGADVVLMVVPKTTDDDCGAAPPIPLLAGTFHSESNAFAIVYLEDVNPTCPEEIVVPHEVGHLLYAEHDTDTNSDDVAPDPDNHATTSTSTGQKSLMWDGVHPFGTEFLSGLFPANTVPGWADNVEFMSSRSFAIVSGYRAPPPEDCGPNFTVSFNQCDGDYANMQLTATLPGYEVTNAKYQVKFGSGGSWGTIFEGILTCPSQSSLGPFFANALLQTAFGDSYCQIRVQVPACGDGGGIIW